MPLYVLLYQISLYERFLQSTYRIGFCLQNGTLQTALANSISMRLQFLINSECTSTIVTQWAALLKLGSSALAACHGFQYKMCQNGNLTFHVTFTNSIGHVKKKTCQFNRPNISQGLMGVTPFHASAFSKWNFLRVVSSL